MVVPGIRNSDCLAGCGARRAHRRLVAGHSHFVHVAGLFSFEVTLCLQSKNLLELRCY